MLAPACSGPVPLTAPISTTASTTSIVGGPAQLVIKVTRTGPDIPRRGLVFRTYDTWYETHHMTDVSGCSVAVSEPAFDCGDLGQNADEAFFFAGLATAAGTFHYEFAMR